MHNPGLCLRFSSMFLALAMTQAASAVDGETAKTIADLKAQVQALVERVRALEGRPPPAPPADPPSKSSPAPAASTDVQSLMETPADATTEMASAPSQQSPARVSPVCVTERGLEFRSEDNANAIRLGGLLQADYRGFVDEGDSSASKFLIRRARPYASGYFFNDWIYRFSPEFALAAPDATTYSTTIADAFINYGHLEEFQVQAGKFKVPVGLEMLVGPANTTFSERSFPANLTPNRDVGVMIHGSLLEGKVSWAAMVGANARDNTINTGLDLGSGYNGYFRIFTQPMKDEDAVPEALHGLRLGIGGSIGQQQMSSAGTSALFQDPSTDGGNAFFSWPNGLNTQGQRWRISPQLYYNYGPFGLMGEFIAQKQGVNTAALGPGGGNTSWEATAWNVTANYVLTGEEATLDGVVPREAFDPSAGTWGAWEMALRYDGTALGANMFRPVAAGGLGASATSNATAVNGVSWALNWYLNRIIRLGLTVEYNAFTGGGAQGTVVENNELGILTRLQLMY